jgi:hypothetical protein
MSPAAKGEVSDQIARSEALENQARKEQQAAIFLSEVANIRCHNQ